VQFFHERNDVVEAVGELFAVRGVAAGLALDVFGPEVASTTARWRGRSPSVNFPGAQVQSSLSGGMRRVTRMVRSRTLSKYLRNGLIVRISIA
jgi:hypothetical protein